MVWHRSRCANRGTRTQALAVSAFKSVSLSELGNIEVTTAKKEAEQVCHGA
jgi:hypothetical protein